jgi:hypothetical protein
MSFVKHCGHNRDVLHARWREVDQVMDRAEERAGPEDVGDQTLMRGLVTAFPFIRPGLSCLGSGIDYMIGHVETSGVPLPWSRPRFCTIDVR